MNVNVIKFSKQELRKNTDGQADWRTKPEMIRALSKNEMSARTLQV